MKGDKRKTHPNATLNEEQVLSIKGMLGERDKWGRPVWSAAEIARRYASMGLFIGAESIRRIDRGETWAWLNATAAQASQAPEVSKEVVEASLARLQGRLAEGEGEKKDMPEHLRKQLEGYGTLPERD